MIWLLLTLAFADGFDGDVPPEICEELGQTTCPVEASVTVVEASEDVANLVTDDDSPDVTSFDRTVEADEDEPVSETARPVMAPVVRRVAPTMLLDRDVSGPMGFWTRRR